MSANKTTIGYAIQLAGIASLMVGAVLSVHHIAIGVSYLGGAAAFYIGKNIRVIA